MPDPPEGNFIELSMTHGYACAVRADSELVCWSPWSSSAIDSYGSAAPQGDGYAAVSVGSGHACALRTDGSISCWGQPYVEAASPTSGRFVDISAGANDSMCAVREDGELICWMPDREGVQELGGGFVDVSVGAEVCAVRTDATAWCWGGFGVFPSRPPQGAFVKSRPASTKARTASSAPAGSAPTAASTAGAIRVWASRRPVSDLSSRRRCVSRPTGPEGGPAEFASTGLWRAGSPSSATAAPTFAGPTSCRSLGEATRRYRAPPERTTPPARSGPTAPCVAGAGAARPPSRPPAGSN